MRNRRPLLLAVVPFVVLCGPRAAPEPDSVAGRAQSGQLGKVGVWYVTFFTVQDEFHHWADIDKRKGAMPTIGRYDCSDPKVIEHQWREMRECGIDFLVMDDTNTVFVDNSLVDRCIRAWFDFMDAKPAAERIPMAIATGGELNQHANRDGWLGAVDYLWKTFAQRPSYLRYRGRPVLNWYIEKDVWPEWDDRRWTVRRTFHFFRMDGQKRYGGWGFGTDGDPPVDGECVSFHPGWDLSPPGHPRENGNFYRRMWLKVLRANPRPPFVLLSDWNGWNEGTALEDSATWKDDYGTPAPAWYRDLTRGYIAAYKWRAVEGYHYRRESEREVYLRRSGRFVYQNVYPGGKPVIVVPELPGRVH